MSTRDAILEMRARRVYVSGPMRGYPELNFPAFLRAEQKLAAAGFIVFNPVNIGRDTFGPNPSAVAPQEFLRADIRAMLECGAIALLPGWEASVGARAEAAVAVALGFVFYDAETLEVIDAPESVNCTGYGAAA